MCTPLIQLPQSSAVIQVPQGEMMLSHTAPRSGCTLHGGHRQCLIFLWKNYLWQRQLVGRNTCLFPSEGVVIWCTMSCSHCRPLEFIGSTPTGLILVSSNRHRCTSLICVYVKQNNNTTLHIPSKKSLKSCFTKTTSFSSVPPKGNWRKYYCSSMVARLLAK